MRREDEPFRLSSSGLEPLPPDDRDRNERGGTGFQDKKKVIILLALLLAGAGVAAYQFLGGRGPKQAAAVTLKGAGAPLPAAKDIDAILERLEAPGQGGDDGSVARVEELVRRFDGYVQERQVPLAALRANPFVVAMEPPEKAQSVVEVKAGRGASPADEAAAKAQRIREAASRLVLGSVLVARPSNMAVISGNLCMVGDQVEGFHVEAIEADRVRLTCEGETVDLVIPTGAAKTPVKGTPSGRIRTQ